MNIIVRFSQLHIHVHIQDDSTYKWKYSYNRLDFSRRTQFDYNLSTNHR
jgi:hypothetical protein